jgi:hypothetical protein
MFQLFELLALVLHLSEASDILVMCSKVVGVSGRFADGVSRYRCDDWKESAHSRSF